MAVGRLFATWVEHFLTVPDPWQVIAGVHLVVSAEDFPEIKTVTMRIQRVFTDKITNVTLPHKVLRVVKINLLNRHLVGYHRVTVIRDPLGDPIVTGTRFKIPGFIAVSKQNPVGLRRAVMRHDGTQPLDAFTSGFDVGQGDRDHGFFTNAIFD